MARTFAGGGEKITCSLGGTAVTAPVTLAALIKRGADAATHNVWTSANSTYSLQLASNNKLRYNISAGSVDAPTITPVAADGWQLVAITKATGTVAPRFHQYKVSSNAWVHENGATTIADPTNPSGSSNIGGGTGNYVGDVAILGVWNVVLTDAQIELLPFSLPFWYAIVPKALWPLDQSVTTQKVRDLTGGGANESALVGTAVSANSVPLLSYGAPLVHVQRQPAAVGGGAAGSRDLLLLGAG